MSRIEESPVRTRVSLEGPERWLGPRGPGGGYYGTQVLLSGPWHWLVTWYFWLGGISGASYLLAVTARAFGGRRGRDIARAGHLVSLVAIAPAPVLLVLDLGRKARFHHMLRVFKPLSPMNLGAWALSAFGLASGLSAWHELADMDALPGPLGTAGRHLPAGAVAVTGAAAGLYFSGYTGTLLAATAIPLWARTPLLGPLFMASAAATGGEAVEGALALAGRESTQLEAPRVAAMLGEAALSAAYLHALGPEARRPLTRGRSRHWFRAYEVLGLGVPLVVTVLPGRRRRDVRLVAAGAALAGGFCLRAAIVRGGHESAEDPSLVLG